ncbi:biotin carboxylase N-terminal domain-containing protein [Salinisphaera sp. T31B1]|uniref:acetyl/propionyl/methylcrotonyl-CoA carboxylase subunit alpha n=1 Tax=Salinisphaera sp. T31B1 TaxID=727963 RepID=UPI00334002E3
MSPGQSSGQRPIGKLLVANRGEIAVRIIDGARSLGIATVAVYSDADAQALHVTHADEAVHLGASPAGESYLSSQRLLEAARVSGADAVHPGYGFLAENAAFAQAVADAGLIFVGPDASAIELMGAKRAAKQRMIAAGVPCVPGYEDADQSDEVLLAEGERIGCPLMVKASAGGGGRGMRLVEHIADLGEALRSARSEAASAFGSDELILEKAVLGARHVEIQVLADHYGHVIHLGERDCSVQRRHQKVVEEAPSPAVDAPLRERMGQAAVDAAAAIDYRGAGTVEFLLEPGGAFYFMEMNTRLQVEHPVTEQVTGIDLVAWQLRIAAGEPLALEQTDIRFSGHAIEVRLCLEDVAQDFMPQTGRVLRWAAPAGQGIRADHGLKSGQWISPHYDSMVAKLVAWGENRDIARRRLIAALADTVLFGPTSNRDFLIGILKHQAFAGGEFDIGFVGTHMPAYLEQRTAPAVHRALAAALSYDARARELAESAGLAREQLGWRSAYTSQTPVVLDDGESRHAMRLIVDAPGCYRVHLDEQWRQIEVLAVDGVVCTVRIDGLRQHAQALCEADRLWLFHDGVTARYVDALRQPPADALGAGDGRVAARMDGRIQRIDVAAGDRVAVGDALIVLEAMKMEFTLSADIAGTVETVACAQGDQVAARQLLVTIAADTLAD